MAFPLPWWSSGLGVFDDLIQVVLTHFLIMLFHLFQGAWSCTAPFFSPLVSVFLFSRGSARSSSPLYKEHPLSVLEIYTSYLPYLYGVNPSSIIVFSGKRFCSSFVWHVRVAGPKHNPLNSEDQWFPVGVVHPLNDCFPLLIAHLHGFSVWKIFCSLWISRSLHKDSRAIRPIIGN